MDLKKTKGVAIILLGRISGRQLFLLTWLLAFATSIIYLPAALAVRLQQDAWIAFLLGVLPIIPMWLVIIGLGKVFPGLSAMEWSRELLGNTRGTLLGLVFMAFFTFLAGVVVRISGELFSIAFMPETPLWVFIITAVVAGGYAAWHGLESIARGTEILFPFIILLAIFQVLAQVRNVDLKLIEPFFISSPARFAAASLIPAANYGEIVVFILFLPSLYRPGSGTREGLSGTIFSAVMLAIIGVFMLGIFGPAELARMNFSGLELAQNVRVGRFFERLESLVLGIWMMAIFLKIGLLYHGVVIGLAEWLRLKNYRNLVIPVGIVLAFTAFFAVPNYLNLTRFMTTTWPFLALGVELGLPVLLLLLAVVKKGRKKKDGQTH